MGTRNLTMVITNSETKVAQYGQWDGYPEGQGVTALTFLSVQDNVIKLKEKLSSVRFLDAEGKDKDFIEAYEKNTPNWSSEPDNRTAEQKRWWDTYMSRDIAAEILSAIANSNDQEIVLGNQESFASDSLFCEWAYVVDLDKNTFEVYSGFNKSPLPENERFYQTQKEGGEYFPVKHLKTFDLANLPTSDEFVKAFIEEEEEA